MRACLVQIILCCLCFANQATFGGSTVLTFTVPERSRECFYEHIDLNKHTGQVEFDFAVMDGGDLYIELEFEDPDGNIHFQGERRLDGALNLNVTRSGSFKICFSNVFSTFTAKQVFFELDVHSKDDTVNDSAQFYRKSDLVLINDQIEMNLDDVQHSQKDIRIDSYHGYRKSNQPNFRVLWEAVITTAGMLVTSIGQIFLLRSFFHHKSMLFRRQDKNRTPTFPASFVGSTLPNTCDAFISPVAG